MSATVKRKPVKSTSKKKATPRKVAAPVKQVPVKATPKPKKATERQQRGLDAEGKAQMIEAHAKEHGWWVKVSREKDIIKLVAKHDDGRYKDTISIDWIGGKGTLLYVAEDGRTVRFRNLAAVKHHIDGTALIKRPTQSKRQRKQRRVILDEEGNAIARKGDEDYKPIGADIVDHWYHITAKRPKGNTHLAPVINSLVFDLKKSRESLEAEGYTVSSIECTSAKEGNCGVCGKTAEAIAATLSLPAPKPRKTTARKMPVKKQATKRSK